MTELSTLEKQKQLLSQKKARLQKQTALLKVKERKLQLSHYIRVGELAEKAGIASLDLPTLLGAFVFLKEISDRENKKEKWFQNGSNLLTSSLKVDQNS